MDHANPYWDHHEPAKPQAADERIEKLSYPSATYPGVHESCDILTIGQYLQPTPNHLPIDRFVEPDVFKRFEEQGLARGFKVVESGPMVRSSYHADIQANALTDIEARRKLQKVESLIDASKKN